MERDIEEIWDGLTDEQWEDYCSRANEIKNRIDAEPRLDRGESLFSVSFSNPDTMTDWLMNKYRAVYDAILLSAEIAGKSLETRADDREMFAARVVMTAGGFFRERFGAALHVALKSVAGELDESLHMLLEATFVGSEDDHLKRFAPSSTQVVEIWRRIVKKNLDPRFVRDGRGGDRKSGAKLTEAERASIAERKEALIPFWKDLIDQFEKNDYANDVWGWIRERQQFKQHCAKYGVASLQILDSLIPDVLKRRPYWENRNTPWKKDSADRMPEPLYPSSFALRHAALEMSVNGHYWDLKNKVGSSGKASRTARKPRAREIKK